MSDKAYMLWTTGRPLEAGRILYERLPVANRPLWAAALLDVCAELLPPVLQITNVITIAREPTAWADSRTAFDAIRHLILEVVEAADATDLYKSLLVLAENVAKVTYNATGGSAPYDYHAGWRIAKNVRQIVELHQNQEFEARAWRFLCGEAAR